MIKSNLWLNLANKKKIDNILEKISNSTVNVILDKNIAENNEILIKTDDQSARNFLTRDMDILLQDLNAEDIIHSKLSLENPANERYLHLYYNNQPKFALSFQEYKLSIIFLDILDIKNFTQNPLIIMLDKSFVSYNDCKRFAYGLCVEYQNIKQISDLYLLLFDILKNDFKSADGSVLKVDDILEIMMDGFISNEINRLNNLQRLIKNDSRHLLSKHIYSLNAAMNILKYLLKSKIHIKTKFNKNNSYLCNLRHALIYEDIFENTPDIIMQSFSELNFCFRSVMQNFLN